MEMDHARSVRMSDRRDLRKELDEALDDVPAAVRMRIARAATLSAPEAKRLLGLAQQRHEGLDQEKVDQAREIIENFAVTPR